MAANDDLIDFDIIENQKENIQSLPGGRSARELARIFSPRETDNKLASPSPNDTRTLNDAIRQEYETELQSIGESDDPLDIYDRYVKWALNAYPSSQATPESGLLPLLERAVRAFLSSPHYKNDPRYLRIWLHYIRLFSDSPRETFAFLARHHIGEGLALFYEEFAAWLESAGRWTQADEVYRLGVDREARPTERLIRKYSEFQQRYEQRTQDNGPSSPALPTVRPALAAKVDPFTAAAASSDPQAERPSSGVGGTSKTKSGKPKMAIFSDAGGDSQPAVSEESKGWDNVSSLHDRRKENKVEARPWAGETLKAGKKAAPTQKMTIFRDESNSKLENNNAVHPKQLPEHRVREAVNPRTGRRERVFVNLDAVYPDISNPAHEMSFEELRAMNRGWMDKNWHSQKEPLRQISGNENQSHSTVDKDLQEQFEQKLTVKDASHSADPDSIYERKMEKEKARKLKLREVKGETQTVKMKFDSPSKSKSHRKSTREPTMTMHTRAATDEIYDIFNQPLKAEAEVAESSDFEDDDYTSAGESTTGHLSAASSDFGDDETTFHKSFDDTVGEGLDNTQAGSVIDGEWTQYSANHVDNELSPAHSPSIQQQEISDEAEDLDGVYADERPERQRFVPQMPEDYNPPSGLYRDPEVMAQNRLPFMTPIVEQTEHSFASTTAARNSIYSAKTPSKPQIGDLATPLVAETPHHLSSLPEDVTLSPTAIKARTDFLTSSPLRSQEQRTVIIPDAQCNPTSTRIRNTILQALEPPLSSYHGYHDQSHLETQYAPEIQKFMKTHTKRTKSGDEMAFDVPILDFPRAERNYIVRRELGAGAYAPVYLAESVDSLSSDSEMDTGDDEDSNSSNNRSVQRKSPRYGFEALKLEVGPPSAWEFYMIRTAHERLSQHAELARVIDSIIDIHELHVFKGESILVEDYRGQGTLLDLVNFVRNEPLTANSSGEGGLDEVLAMFFAVELFRTVESLHSCGIIHGDIKADNCLVRLDDKSRAISQPSLIDLDTDENFADPREIHYSPRGSHGWRTKGLSLIDFGRAIDMQAFEPSVQFIADWEPKNHECNEVRENRPWTHQIDLYGLAGTIHVMLFGKYIESAPVRSSESATTCRTYRIRESFKRYWERDLWNDVFDLLLNPGAPKWADMEREGGNFGAAAGDENSSPVIPPVLNSMRYVRERMEEWLMTHAEKKCLGLQIRKLEAMFAEKKRRLERS